MKNLKERETNLFNATDTLAQFYDEIESFFSILFNNMERSGYNAKSERLRSGTFTIKDLSRRLLATAMVIYVKGVGQSDDDLDEDDNEIDEVNEKLSKTEVPITDALRIPFVQVSLFVPRTIPSVRTLTSPMLHLGAVGKPVFFDKKTGKPAKPENPVLSLSSLSNIRLGNAKKAGDIVKIPCSRPSRMRKYKMEAKLIGYEGQRLLEIDSQEKIRSIADQLVAFAES